MLNKEQDGGDHDHQTPPDDPYDPSLGTLDLGEEESEAEAESEDDVVIMDDITVDSELNSNIQDFGSILDSSEEVVEEKEDIALKDGIEDVARSLESATEGDYRRKDAKDITGSEYLKGDMKEEYLGSDDKKKEYIIANDDITNDGVTKDDSVVRYLEFAMEGGDSSKDMEDASGSDDAIVNSKDLSMQMKKGIPKKDSVGMIARCLENVTVTEDAKLAKDADGVTMIDPANLKKNEFDVTMEEDIATEVIIENAGLVKDSENIVESHGVNADQADVHMIIDGKLKHVPINADVEAGNFTKHAIISGQDFDVEFALDELSLDSDELKKLEGVVKNVSGDVALKEGGYNGVTKKSIFRGSNEAGNTNEKNDKIDEWQVLNKTYGSCNTVTDNPCVLSGRNEQSLTDGGTVVDSERKSDAYFDSRNIKKEDTGVVESNLDVDELKEVEGLDEINPSINDDNSNVSNFEDSEEEYDFGSDEEDVEGGREIIHRTEIVSVDNTFDMHLLRDELATAYVEHAKNEEENEILSIPLIPIRHDHEKDTAIQKSYNKHILFVLDESGSMVESWPGVVVAYKDYIQHRRQHQFEHDLISIIQFDCGARITCTLQSIIDAPTDLDFEGGSTSFLPAALLACEVVNHTPASHVPVIIFMSDGAASDSQDAARIFADLNREWKSRVSSLDEIELHVIGFGDDTSLNQLQDIAGASNRGKVHSAANIDSLLNVFIDIADGDKVSTLLEDAISQRISDAVVDRLTAECIR
ncbi:hypothetical protein FRACYDRAFT_235129 [Fragilariopsis cylindrus CCMP1102]|uniref:VWFA domain-containing protein n=1 Tax=Fragilariopsis cylindrus CCMP1102 TaxID=635003 RepID=A0A1E7FTK6_9STRA|nr:hypothetical protein FRACYDRAFT_235129 [Fragilariopsis cylindrus CCMP1102]|eukprot:OEU21502.1 hypothetical protein FRACYDRAFT_235129 [Fragilariopsis cylindrus CCMP1102]